MAGEAAAHVVADTPDGMAFLDRSPVFPGHVLVVPRRHVPELRSAAPEELAALFGLVQRVAAAVPDALGAGGTWVSINNVVSQSVPHLHVHVVPRTRGDGLRGFFWPRRRYADEAEMAATAAMIAAAVAD